MKSNDVTNELQDGFEPAPLPPIAPDGGLELPPLLPALPPHPRLCEAGPCRHYHTFRVQTEAQEPMGAAILPAVGAQHGRVIGAAPEEFRTQDHHYCYPDVGIETRLGELPVISCNRWDPIGSVLELEMRRDAFIQSAEGKARDAELAAWQAARDTQEAAARAHEEEARRLVQQMVDRAEADNEAAALADEADKIQIDLDKQGDA